MSGWGIQRLRGLLKRTGDGPTLKVHLMIKGRIGPGWYDVDKTLKLPVGYTLGALVEEAPQLGVPLVEALRDSPHLSETLMWNGERCPVAEHAEREFADGDTLYLLAPIAGG